MVPRDIVNPFGINLKLIPANFILIQQCPQNIATLLIGHFLIKFSFGINITHDLTKQTILQSTMTKLFQFLYANFGD